MVENQTIPLWWSTISEDDINCAYKALESRKLSQGEVVNRFEEEFSDIESGKYGVATTSGTTALQLAGLAAGIKTGDEVIIPNRTWIATAHAFKLLGAKIKICSVSEKNMILDIEHLQKLITSSTKVIVPVSLNGRNAITKELIDLAKKNNIWIIEDAAQGIACPRPHKYIEKSNIKYCRTYSFSMAKLISSGQGGMIVTNDLSFYKELKERRTHGIKEINNVNKWNKLGSNFRMSNVLASIALNQLKRIEFKKQKHLENYKFYLDNVDPRELSPIHVDIENGEIPIYSEFLSRDRSLLTKKLRLASIETREFYPDISSADYLFESSLNLPETIFSSNGIYLPSGDGLEKNHIKRLVQVMKI